MLIYLQRTTRVVDRAVADAGTVSINWRSITHMINSQPKFAELDPPVALEVKFLAKKFRQSPAVLCPHPMTAFLLRNAETSSHWASLSVQRDQLGGICERAYRLG